MKKTKKVAKKVKKPVAKKSVVNKPVKKPLPKKKSTKKSSQKPLPEVIGAQAPGKDGIVYANALDKINASLSKPKKAEHKSKAVRTVEETAVPEVKVIDVLGNIDKGLKKPEEPPKKPKAVNRKGTVVIEAEQDEVPQKPGKSIVMTGDGPKLVNDNGEEE